MKYFVFTIYILFEIGTLSNSQYVTVGTQYGDVKGVKLTSRNGKAYTSFKGIQYGVIKKRFQEAHEPESWNGVKDTLDFGYACPQPSGFGWIVGKLSTNENCLFLNLYTHEGSTEMKPVIFYIHGGGFIIGSGQDVDEKYFMDQDIILITINYRLGAFGFMALSGIADSPDNLGLRDQLLALKWVKANIQQFGGDPDRITIMGESAGASSVSLFLLSPSTGGGLFHRAILHSGATLNSWTWWSIEKSERNAKRIGKILGCDISPNIKLLECLRETDIDAILKAQSSLAEFYTDPYIAFFPVAGNSDSTAFLPEKPDDLIHAGKLHKVPTIVTVCEKEGFFINAATIIKSEEHMKALDEDWVTNGYITGWFSEDKKLPNLNPAQKQEMMVAVRKYYFGDKPLKANDLWTMTRLEEFYTDRICFYGISETARALSQFTPVFIGMFTDVGADSVTNRVFGHNQSLGMTHVDDLQFFFETFGFGSFTLLTEELKEYSQNLVQIWANFAKTGIPSGTVGGLEFEWTPISKEERSANELLWLNLGQIPKTIRNPFADRLQFWNKIYHTYGSSYQFGREEL